MPTPRPIIRPSWVAKSGMVMRLESRPTVMVPMPMPARATLMGRPMASTDPKARTRMTMAKATPSSSDDGGSNSPKMAPPSSICRPACSGMASWMSSLIAMAFSKVTSGSSSTTA